MSEDTGWLGEDIERRLKAAFDHFDLDGNGRIDVGELRQVMAELNRPLDEQELEEIFAETDLDGDGRIDFGEFRKMMLDDVE